MNQCEAVKMAMLSVIRHPWEHGTAMQAVYETGDKRTTVAMAHDAMLRQMADGRLAVLGRTVAVTDPASNGEGVWRAYEITGDKRYLEAAEKMKDYLLQDAPRTDKNIILHNEVSFYKDFSEKQIWVDSAYMAPPFLAVMGEVKEAVFQIEGMLDYLRDPETGIMFHIYDAGTERFVRKKLWASGNGWALLGLIRVAEQADKQGFPEERDRLLSSYGELLDAILKFQLPDGRFHDILDDPDSFVEGTAAMMLSASLYRAVYNGFLPSDYLPYADKTAETMENYVDEYGIIHEVCGCPDFMNMGTSAESMAAYLMMHAWKGKVEDGRP